MASRVRLSPTEIGNTNRSPSPSVSKVILGGMERVISWILFPMALVQKAIASAFDRIFHREYDESVLRPHQYTQTVIEREEASVDASKIGSHSGESRSDFLRDLDAVFKGQVRDGRASTEIVKGSLLDLVQRIPFARFRRLLGKPD